MECGDTDHVLAHHMKPRREFPELRFELDNGLTVCPRCHHILHLEISLKSIGIELPKDFREKMRELRSMPMPCY